MPAILPVASLTLYDVIQKFHLQEVQEDSFIQEWLTGLPDLTEIEKQRLDEVKAQYLYLNQRPFLETIVKMVVLSPLLALAGLYQPPFWITAETSIDLPTIHANDRAEDHAEEILRGKIDILVCQDRLWIVVIEAKAGNYDVMQALPQALTYMMASPQTQRVVYGMALNGRELFFIKLEKTPQPRYALSEVFSLSRRGNDLYPAFQILKKITIASSEFP
jgi:hypothetical protein